MKNDLKWKTKNGRDCYEIPYPGPRWQEIQISLFLDDSNLQMKILFWTNFSNEAISLD